MSERAKSGGYACVVPGEWAFVSELYDADLEWAGETEFSDRWAAGVFSVHLERREDPSDPIEDGPYGVELDQALGWARDRADRVMVRIDEPSVRQYSAGVVAVADCPMWPPPGFLPRRRRASGYEFFDRTEADEAIPWTALVVIQYEHGPHLEEIAASFLTHLNGLAMDVTGVVTAAEVVGGAQTDESGAPRIVSGHPGLHGNLGLGEAVRVRFRVSAATERQAFQHAEVLATRALELASTIFAAHGWDLDSITVYPEGSYLAELNCAIEDDSG